MKHENLHIKKDRVIFESYCHELSKHIKLKTLLVIVFNLFIQR